MKLSTLVMPIVALAALGAAPAASAAEWWQMDEPGFFIGGGIGYSWLKGEFDTAAANQPDDFDGSNVFYKVPFGVRFNRMFALEGQYIDFGTNDDGDNELKAHGWTSDLVVSFAVNPHFMPYVKAGALFWQGDAKCVSLCAPQQERDDNGTDFTFGAGLKFPVTPKIDVRVEYERFRFGDVQQDDSGSGFDLNEGPKANTASAAVVFTF